MQQTCRQTSYATNIICDKHIMATNAVRNKRHNATNVIRDKRRIQRRTLISTDNCGKRLLHNYYKAYCVSVMNISLGICMLSDKLYFLL